jgi:hypothetical protein
VLRARRSGGIALLLAFAGFRCPPDAEPGASVAIVLSKRTATLESTELGPALKISVSLTNGSRQLVLLSTCEYALDQYRYTLATGRNTDDWLEVWRSPCTVENGLAYTPVGPGETFSFPITVIATPALSPDFGAEPGTYRFRFFLSTQAGGEYRQLARERTVSEPFTLLER